MPKVISLNEEGETVSVVLNRMQEKAEHLDGVVIVAHWKDDAGGGWFVDWSHMNMGTFAYAKEVLAFKVHRSLDSIYDPHASNNLEDNIPDNRSSGDAAEDHGSTDGASEGSVSRLLDRKREPGHTAGQITGAGPDVDTPDQ